MTEGICWRPILPQPARRGGKQRSDDGDDEGGNEVTLVLLVSRVWERVCGRGGNGHTWAQVGSLTLAARSEIAPD
jgi:hypothetical protein